MAKALPQPIAQAATSGWIACALKDVGLDPSVDLDLYAQRIYLDHLQPADQDRLRVEARKMANAQSGCGLAWERWARCMQVSWPHLYMWYGDRLGTALSANVSEAKKCGAWVDADRAASTLPGLPQPGDAVLIGGPEPYSRGGIIAEHLLLVRQIDGALLHSIDGGQPGIQERTRVLITTPQDELWLANLPTGGGQAPLGPDGRPLVGRRVRGWIDHTRLPYLVGPTPPSPTPKNTTPTATTANPLPIYTHNPPLTPAKPAGKSYLAVALCLLLAYYYTHRRKGRQT